MSSKSDEVLEAMDRAQQAFGLALSRWMLSEISRPGYDFANMSLALHTVVAGVATRSAMAVCPSKSVAEMKVWYTELVLICLEEQFETMSERLNGSAVH